MIVSTYTYTYYNNHRVTILLICVTSCPKHFCEKMCKVNSVEPRTKVKKIQYGESEEHTFTVWKSTILR